MTTTDWRNKLYFGDNLDILKEHITDQSVDLIYLDPPFNSNATYNVLFHERSRKDSAAEITAFEDTWRWNRESAIAYRDVVRDGPPKLGNLLQAIFPFLGRNDLMAYLTIMAQRMVEFHRVLKPTGSIYLHCDPTASHYLKLMMDAVFGHQNFHNEIIWHYRKWSTGKYAFQRNHDVILFYSRSVDNPSRAFNQLYMPRAESTVKRFGNARIVSSHDTDGRRLPSQTGNQESQGVRQDDVWDIKRVAPIKQFFPTQKPELLLERIIRASSNEGDVVLDPFSGCGTTIVEAETSGRRWIGIDITHLAISIIKSRLRDSFGPDLSDYDVLGVPQNVESARALALKSEGDGRRQFEYWALGLVDALPCNKSRRGADPGIDGYISFFDDNSGRAKRIIVQVKSGHNDVSQIRDLRKMLSRENAEIGLFITLNPPDGPMIQEAASSGIYTPEHYPWHNYPRVQLLTVKDMLAGAKADHPRFTHEATMPRAPRRRRSSATQPRLT